MKTLKIRAIRSKKVKIHQPILPWLLETLSPRPLRDGDILVVSSKVISLCEGQWVANDPKKQNQKDLLIQKQASKVFGKAFGSWVTLTKGLLCLAAGIDQSNIESGFLLLPKDSWKTALKIQRALKKKFKIKNLGVIIIDSRSQILRKGTVGQALGYAGFLGVENLMGVKDLTGKKLKISHRNVADSLAAAANFSMGESDEMTPLCVIRGATVQFSNRSDRKKFEIPWNQDYFVQGLKLKI